MTDFTSSVPVPETATSSTQTSSSARHTGEVRALFRGHLIASSENVYAVRQAGEPTQYYFPQDAVEMAVLRPNDRSFTSALGEARYFTLYRDREILEDAAWTYASASANVADIGDMIAFNPEYVDIEIDEKSVAAESPIIDDYIRHTDSGSGTSQEQTWDPTVGRPGDGA